MKGLRRHISYANVVATLALFVALAGGAYAAELIGPQDIAKDAVRSRHIDDGAVRHKAIRDGNVNFEDIAANTILGGNVAANTLTGGNVAADTLTGGNIDESTLDVLHGTTVRSKTHQIETDCVPGGPGIEFCDGRAEGTAQCAEGEQATGGSAEPTGPNSDSVGINEDAPTPATGTPTGWRGDASFFVIQSDFEPDPTAEFIVYVICAR